MQSFDTYTDLVEIGSGGMATVYRATAPNGNLVALKVLALHLASDPTARMRFEQESNLGLSHPNIVRVVESGVKDGAPFIVMEYVVGESLDHRLGRVGFLSPQGLAPILRDAARALDYAHARGVIHRDVKPSNILIRSNGQALLADFGVAKSASLTAYTATAVRVGSVYYMSPEQADGALEITPASDIYSLGVTAYYALTGRHPFEGDNEIAIARMHLDSKPRHASELNPALPKSVDAVIMQALEKDPARRPASAGEFATAFEQAALVADRAPVPIQRLRTMAAILAVVLCAVPILTLAVTRFLPMPFGVVHPVTETVAPFATTPAEQPFVIGLETATDIDTATATAIETAVPATASGTATWTETPAPPTATATRRPRPSPTATRRVVKPAPTATRRPSLTRTRVPTVMPDPTTPVPTTPAVTPEPSDTVTVEPPTATPQPPTAEPTVAPPTDAPPTQVPPTDAPPTEALRPTAEPTDRPPTTMPPTEDPPPTP